MSNKSRLQTNNTNLQLLINKANALPNAGSGSGGAVETCIVQIICDGPTSGEEIIYYTDGSGTLKSAPFPNFMESNSVTVLKNSIICVSSGYFVRFGDAEDIPVSSSADRVLFVFGDTTLQTM